MAGINSKALAFGDPENKYKFNDGTELGYKEFANGLGLELYETPYRGYDPQIGRFQQIDPLSFVSSDHSPYAFALNNPVLRNDPTGLKDSVKVLPEVIVTSKPKKLVGGTYHGISFNSIKGSVTGGGGLTKLVLNNEEAINRYQNMIKDAKTLEDKLKLIGSLGGGSLGIKSAEKYKDFIKALVTGKLRPDPFFCLSVALYAEGMKYGWAASDLQNILNTYNRIHAAEPENMKGVYQITKVSTIPSSWNGVKVIITSSFYDISTKIFLGESTIQ